MTDFFLGLEQHLMLLEMRRLEVRLQLFEIGLRKQAQQKVLHGSLPKGRRERKELSAIGAYSGIR